MGLPGVDLQMIVQAIAIYEEVAWGEEAERNRRRPDVASWHTVEDALAAFTPDNRTGRMRRFALRLGNRRYPFMKLVLQELLVRDRFFFAVDTHDELDLKESMPDYEAWLELKRWNREIKETVERRWDAIGLPTFSRIVADVEKETPTPEPLDEDAVAPLVLVVDDDGSIARGVDAILKSQGYRTSIADSGEAALERLERERPDLVLSDLEMGGMSGLDLAARIRGDQRLEGIPFVLATAATVDASHFTLIDAFLVKPYETRILLKFVREHLRSSESRPEDA